MKYRCGWATTDDLYLQYHDEEWGVPEHDDRKLFEMLILEGAQAGLSWSTILNKRVNYRRAFENFDPRVVAGYGEEKIADLLGDRGIVRNRLKITSAVKNARLFLKIQQEYGSFNSYIWQFTKGKAIQNSWSALKFIPANTKESDNMSRDLKKRGFKFAGSTICYAFMQAIGMVNDHITDCFRYAEIKKG